MQTMKMQQNITSVASAARPRIVGGGGAARTAQSSFCKQTTHHI